MCEEGPLKENENKATGVLAKKMGGSRPESLQRKWENDRTGVLARKMEMIRTGVLSKKMGRGR